MVRTADTQVELCRQKCISGIWPSILRVSGRWGCAAFRDCSHRTSQRSGYGQARVPELRARASRRCSAQQRYPVANKPNKKRHKAYFRVLIVGLWLTTSMSHGRQPPLAHESGQTEPAASRWFTALVLCFGHNRISKSLEPIESLVGAGGKRDLII